MKSFTDAYHEQIQAISQLIEENQQLLADPELKALAEQELIFLNEQKAALEQALTSADESSVSSQVYVPKSCIVEIRAGAGGDEAKIWGADLMRMYMRFCDTLQFKVDVLDELVFKIRGKKMVGEEEVTAYEYFHAESGVHRVQRVPATEAQGRIHTSTASVAVLPEVNEKSIIIRQEDLLWNFTRAGGAGGQNVNKVNSAVELTHIPTGLRVDSRRERHQERNREIALDLLRSRLWEQQEEKRLEEIGDARAAIGRNMRAEKIKTYNYPQNRLTDHRINKSWHSLSEVVEGDLEDVLDYTYLEFHRKDLSADTETSSAAESTQE